MPGTCALLGAPIETGASQRGCIMGPASLRTAGLAEGLAGLGWEVSDRGDVSIAPQASQPHANPALHHLAETSAWIAALHAAAYEAGAACDLPIFMGGDHSMAAGTVPAMARRAQEAGRPLFVLWLDAHPDLHTLETSESRNLHGTPVAYFTGQPGCDAYPTLPATVDPANICMMGIRSVDAAEQVRIRELSVEVHDMRAIDETGVLEPLRRFLDRVREANGMLHVSFDVDFLDPAIAPAVGTTVPGGATFREAHLIMETLCDSELVSSLDLVELNPFLDERGKAAKLMCDLTASLFGRRVMDRMTRSAY
ncbi:MULTISPECIES: arginase [Salipiger]|uniref:arginase n=1 Tax=Salipiger TaxID=263377 RepID=UPI003513B082